MAAVGGGFMSDYDVLPLGLSYLDDNTPFELPINGDFTAYEVTPTNTPLPNLLSGSEDEWNRLAINILNTAINQAKNVTLSENYKTSDMFALIAEHSTLDGIEKKPSIGWSPQGPFHGKGYLPRAQRGASRCSLFDWANHYTEGRHMESWCSSKTRCYEGMDWSLERKLLGTRAKY